MNTDNNTNNTNNAGRTNPFFAPYGTPHDTVPFDRITVADFEEAFMEGIRRDNEYMQRMTSNPEAPTFENTIINPFDDNGYYDLLDDVSTVFFNLLSAETNDEMDALAQKMSPILTQHANDMSLNPEMFKRVKSVYEQYRDHEPGEDKILVDNCYEGLIRNGAALDEKGKARLRMLTEKLSMLSLQFSQNLLKETKKFKLNITNKEMLSGLPDTAMEAAAKTAAEDGNEGWTFTLDMPSYGPFITYADNRNLRKQMFMARNTLCVKKNDENNVRICRDNIKTKLKLAQLLGYQSYAD
ncbi:MAG: M3 family metallopeptidase, partial [Prevotellaceae bacterium]|nr:M3 family metallopeptidase [Prevotellaceae bacterium]